MGEGGGWFNEKTRTNKRQFALLFFLKNNTRLKTVRSCFDWHGMETPLSPPYVFTSFLSVAVALAILKVAVETEPTHVTTHTELYPEHLPAARTACFKSSPGWRRRAIALHSILYKGDADKDNSFSLERIFTVTALGTRTVQHLLPEFSYQNPKH